MPLKYWADKYEVSYQGLRNRYFLKEKNNYSVEEIIFGRKKKRGSKAPKNNPTDRAKASKMISSYKSRDVKNGTTVCDIDID